MRPHIINLLPATTGSAGEVECSQP